MTGAAKNERWLHVTPAVPAPPDGSNVGEVIRWHRKRRNLTQQEAAALLSTTQSSLSKLENDTTSLGIDELRFIADKLGIPPDQLGLLPDRSAEAIPKPEKVSTAPGAPLESQQWWCAVRRELNENRARLGDLASELYPKAHRISESTVLTIPEWMPDKPVELRDVELQWLLEDAAKPPIVGTIEQTAGVRPLAADCARYSRYSRALRDLARPKLLDNRVGYRLLDVEWDPTGGRLGFGYTAYFDVLDVW